LAGVAVVVGHNWPLALGFRGGRGASPTFGVLAVLMPQEMLILAGAFLIVLVITHSTIWASAVLFAPLPLVAWWFQIPLYLVVYGIALPCLVGLTHLVTTRSRAAVLQAKSLHRK